MPLVGVEPTCSEERLLLRQVRIPFHQDGEDARRGESNSPRLDSDQPQTLCLYPTELRGPRVCPIELLSPDQEPVISRFQHRCEGGFEKLPPSSHFIGGRSTGSVPDGLLVCQVRGVGLEPTRPEGHTVLSRARLPIPTPAHRCAERESNPHGPKPTTSSTWHVYHSITSAGDYAKVPHTRGQIFPRRNDLPVLQVPAVGIEPTCRGHGFTVRYHSM